MKNMIHDFPVISSQNLVPILSLFSITDISWINSDETNNKRFQIGFLLLASYISFIWLLFKEKNSPFVWPLILTATFILFLILYPVIFIGPLKYIDIAQFSYRFISFFQLLAIIMSAMALSTFFRQNNNFNHVSKKILALIIILMSLIFVRPYLYPKSSFSGEELIASNDRLQKFDSLAYADNIYLRIPPENINYIKLDDSQLMKAQLIPNSSNRTFFIELDNIQTEYFLDVLYYPGLQKIDLFIDNKPYQASLETFWLYRLNFGYTLGESGGFHGLKISNLPNKGLLKVVVIFNGSTLANYVSVLSICFFLILFFYSIFKTHFNLYKTLNS
jgi:hypothetical protein